MDAAVPEPVAHGEQLVLAGHVERHVLHRAAGGRAAAVAGVGDAELGRDVGDPVDLHEGEVRVVVQLHEPVPRALDAVHPVEGDELEAEHVAEELDLGLDVAGADGEVVDAARVEPWLAGGGVGRCRGDVRFGRGGHALLPSRAGVMSESPCRWSQSVTTSTAAASRGAWSGPA